MNQFIYGLLSFVLVSTAFNSQAQAQNNSPASQTYNFIRNDYVQKGWKKQVKKTYVELTDIKDSKKQVLVEMISFNKRFVKVDPYSSIAEITLTFFRPVDQTIAVDQKLLPLKISFETPANGYTQGKYIAIKEALDVSAKATPLPGDEGTMRITYTLNANGEETLPGNISLFSQDQFKIFMKEFVEVQVPALIKKKF